MKKAFIIYCDTESKERTFSGEGRYMLVDENDNPYYGVDGEVCDHYCSSRGFANYDLTRNHGSDLDIEKNGITEVYSNGELVWKKDNDLVNETTEKEFDVCNSRYEQKYCR